MRFPLVKEARHGTETRVNWARPVESRQIAGVVGEEQQQATGPILVNHAAVSRRTVKG